MYFFNDLFPAEYNYKINSSLFIKSSKI